MIRLYNQHTGTFLNLIENQEFSISAKSQMQDLETYVICHSFDIECVMDSNLQDALNNHSKIVLYKDSVPLYIGYISLLGSMINKVKVCYKATPFALDFEFRPKLKDYLKKQTYENYPLQARHILENASFNIFPLGTSVISCTVENGAPSESEPFVSNLICDNYENGVFSNLKPDYDYKCYWASTRIFSLLRNMLGITVPSEINKGLYALFPVSISYERKIKVRMYRKLQGRAAPAMKYHEFWATNSSEIWWLDHNMQWERLGATTERGVTAGAFNESIRDMKALSGMTLVDISLPYDYPYGNKQPYAIDTLSKNCDQSMVFNMNIGHQYEDGDALSFHLYPAFAGIDLPDYIDVTFNFKCNIDTNKFKTDYTYRNLYKNVPMYQEDFGFFEMDTAEFLNGLSISCKDYRWLRNPCFINKYNYSYLYGARIIDSKSFQLDSYHLEDISKSIDYEADIQLNYTVEASCPLVYNKILSYMTGEAKEVKSGFTASGFSYNKPLDRSGYPLLIYNNNENEKGWIDNSLKCCFGELRTEYDSDAEKLAWNNKTGKYETAYGRTVRKWIIEQDTDGDFITDYSFKGEVYEIDCVGYGLQEFMDFEGLTFVIGEWSTSDFEKFHLVAYPLTIEPEETFNEPEFQPINWRTSITGGRGNEFEPNGRPVKVVNADGTTTSTTNPYGSGGRTRR